MFHLSSLPRGVRPNSPPLTIVSSFTSLDVATHSTASKPKTQVAVTILQLMGETSTGMRGNRRTTI